MRYGTAAFLGLALGAAAGAGVLYYNPLTVPDSVRPGETDRTFTYRFPEADPLVFTHDGDGRLPVLPRGVEKLWEHTISDAALLSVALRDESGRTAAMATRLSRPSAKTDLLLEGALLADDWLVTVPGEGSLFVHAENNFWPLVKDTLPVWYLKRPWPGPAEYLPTSGPHAAGAALLWGASGRFADVQGTALERYELRRFGDQGPEELVGELRLRLPEPVAVAAP